MRKAVLMLLLVVCGPQAFAHEAWMSLFDGNDLSKWVPKFKGYDVGVNHRNTFRVEGGLLKVAYDNWPDFKGEFGHLFYDEVFSHSILRAEYRFVGKQPNSGPAWAYRNNGLMLHGQSPQSMSLDQEFPASIEVQLLGGTGSADRTTANVCSPGTNYVMGGKSGQAGKLITQHCVNSTSATFHGDQWVTVEIEVRGDELVRHSVNGEVVFEYSQTQLDERDADAQKLLSQGQAIAVTQGYISIQAESHPTEFRKIELLPLAH
jgi:hypothetical protein